jgi:hypothetical protein
MSAPAHESTGRPVSGRSEDALEAAHYRRCLHDDALKELGALLRRSVTDTKSLHEAAVALHEDDIIMIEFDADETGTET